jgi:hypothetical protein
MGSDAASDVSEMKPLDGEDDQSMEGGQTYASQPSPPGHYLIRYSTISSKTTTAAINFSIHRHDRLYCVSLQCQTIHTSLQRP